MTQGVDTYEFSYNGLGDRLVQSVNSSPIDYTLDLASGLTQVLDDGTNIYLYGLTRIGEDQPGGWEYHVGDALGSTRQLLDSSGEATLAREYSPYGEETSSVGVSSTPFGFTGEQTDITGLSYLRARYYAPYLSQWIQPDSFAPDPETPADWNRYRYVRDNPINQKDPSGLCVAGDASCLDAALDLYHRFNWQIQWTGYSDAWTAPQVLTVMRAGEKIASWLGAHGGDGEARLRAEFGPATFHHAGALWTWARSHHVQGADVYMVAHFSETSVIHEMAHVLDNLHSWSGLGAILGGGPSDIMVREMGINPTLCPLRFKCSLLGPSYQQVWGEAFLRDPDVEIPPSGGIPASYARTQGPSEDFATTFQLILAGELGKQAPRRASWFSEYAWSLHASAPSPEGNPYGCHSTPIPLPVPTP